MPPFGPIRRRDLIRYLRRLGFEGPYSGGRHDYMVGPGENRLSIPNPHGGDIDRGLLVRVLRQAGISREEWEEL
jgi:predicted RNA binding protein YcfA (HicA-like mRNA interferase family)